MFAPLRRLLLAPLLALLPALAQPADEAPAAAQPFPTLDAGMHTAPIRRFAVDRAGRYGVSAAHDKTARVWDLQDGRLLQTLRVPVGLGDEGKLYAVAISPDGATVAVGGYTGRYSNEHSVFFFDRASGRLQGRVAGLPNVVNHLAWSPDGRRIAIALGAGGIRVHAATPPFGELGRDGDYPDRSFSVDFDAGGRLVSTCLDGKLRLYDRDLRRLRPPQALEGGSRPFFARFSPDGTRIAVGFEDSSAVQIVSASDLRPLARLDTRAADNGSLNSVAWSADGRRVLAAGTNDVNGQSPIRVFDPDSGRQLAVWPVSPDTVMDLRPLADGRLLFASGDPSWGIVDPQGRVTLHRGPPQADHRGNFDGFRLAADGARVSFVHQTWRNGAWQRSSRVFDWRSLRLEAAEAPPELAPPRRDGLAIEDWFNSTRPRLAGQPLPLKPYEISRSLAVAADGRRFALGSDWTVRGFDAAGTLEWATPVPVAWLVNLSADGRFVVAALSDGTIRWYRARGDSGGKAGSEALALFVHADGERWVAWTPEGFFAASSPEAEKLFGYTLNQGRDKEAVFVSSAQLREQFWRPDLVTARIAGDEAPIAAALEKIGDVREVLAGGLPPEVKLLGVKALDNGEYAFELDIRPRSGGLGRLAVVVDGVEQAAGRGAPVGGMHTLQMPFAPGTPQVVFKVYDRSNRVFSASPPTTVTVAGVAKRPRLHVVAVGVSDYDTPPLRDGVSYAAADAKALVDAIERHRDGTQMDLAPPLLLPNSQATLAAITDALQKVAREAKPEDVLVLFLAGHGVSDDGDYYFQPYEATNSSRANMQKQSLSGEQLRGLLREIKAGKAVLLLDTCTSGSFGLGPAGYAQGTSPLSRFASNSGRAVLSASAGTAREHPSLAHGLFTDALLRGLTGDAADSKGKVQVLRLAAFVDEMVRENSERLFGQVQKPLIELQQGFVNFPLTRKP